MVKTQTISFNHKHGKNSNDEFKSLKKKKNQMTSLNHKYGKNSNIEVRH